MEQNLLNLALALAANELLHNFLEVKNIREKVARLQTYIDKKPYKELPVNIDTRAKSYGISLISFVLIVAVFYGLFCWLSLELSTGLKVIVGLLVASYIVTAVTVDQYHVDIEKVTKRFKK